MKIIIYLFSAILVFNGWLLRPARAAACSGSAPAAPLKIKIETLAEGLEYPWGVAILPDGSALVTEKAGRLRLLKNGKLSTPIAGVPDVLYQGQAGLFDVAAHPDYTSNQLIYLAYAKGTEKENGTALLRAKFDGRALSEIKTLFEAKPQKQGPLHFGGRLLFLPDKTLLLTLGEGFDYREEAQNPDSYLGKIVRMKDDGTLLGNPSGKAGGEYSYRFFSMGHRNAQGLAFDKATNTIYEHEHGPKGGDEINVLVEGRNYGWPKITYGVDYSGLPITDKVAMPGLEQPLVCWIPSIAPSGMTFYDKDLFKAWKGDLLVSALAGQQLRRIDLEAGKAVKQETFLTELNTRFRHIITAPDGSIWVLTDDPKGKILRLTPEK